MAETPPPSPKAATISLVKPNTDCACASPLPSTPPSRFAAGRAEAEVLELAGLGLVPGTDQDTREARAAVTIFLASLIVLMFIAIAATLRMSAQACGSSSRAARRAAG